MVSRKIIDNILEDIITNQITKCREGYIRPQQKLKMFLDGLKNNYVNEDYFDDQDSNNEFNDPIWQSPIGKLQQIQEDLQKNVSYNRADKNVAKSWNVDLFFSMNDYLYKKEGYEKEVYEVDREASNQYLDEYGFPTKIIYDKNNPIKIYVEGSAIAINSHDSTDNFMTIPQMCDHLSTVIDKSPRLAQDTVFYTYRHWDDTIKVGDTGTFNGFTSCSYNPYVAEKQIQKKLWTQKSPRRVLRVWANKGTKGVVMDNNLVGVDWQSEFLLDKGQKYICFGDDGKYVDIFLYDPSNP